MLSADPSHFMTVQRKALDDPETRYLKPMVIRFKSRFYLPEM
jgi:hypothetical protein